MQEEISLANILKLENAGADLMGDLIKSRKCRSTCEHLYSPDNW